MWARAEQQSSKKVESLLLGRCPEGIGQHGVGDKKCRAGKKGEARLGIFRQDIKPGLQLCLFSGVSFFRERSRGQVSLDSSHMKETLFIGKVSFSALVEGRKGKDGCVWSRPQRLNTQS